MMIALNYQIHRTPGTNYFSDQELIHHIATYLVALVVVVVVGVTVF